MDLKKEKWAKVPPMYESAFCVSDFYIDSKQGNYEITLCALGCFKLMVNGRFVGKEICFVGNGEFYSYKYDVSDYVNQGFNRIGILVGNGFYRKLDSRIEDDSKINHLKCAFALNNDGITIRSSSDGMLYKRNHVTKNEIGNIERQDYRFYDENWSKTLQIEGFSTCEEDYFDNKQAIILKNPSPINVVKNVKIESAKKIRCEDGGDMYDMGEIIDGYVVAKPSSDKVKVTYYLDSIDEGQEDIFNNFKQNFILEPEFIAHKFRFFKISGGEIVFIKKMEN